jgi:hypothetical protein
VRQEHVSSVMRARLAALPRSGFQQAVDVLVDRLEGVRS